MLITADFETYYDDEYTLKKMSTSEYIRDKRFRVLNVAIKEGDKPPYVVWGHKAAGAALRKAVGPSDEFLAHHAHFEGLILSHHFGIVPHVYRDTLSMGRALFPKSERNDLGSLAARLNVSNKLEMPDFKGKTEDDLTPDERAAVERYVVGDVEACAQAYVKMVERMPAAEMELIDITVRMFADPILKLDMPRARAELERERKAKAEAIAKGGIALEELASSNKFAVALEKLLGYTPPQKISKKTGKLTWAFAQTDTDFTGLVNHVDPLVGALVEARLAAKSTIGETRALRLIKAGTRPRRLPVYLNYCGAHTTRWSGGDKLNFQNFPRLDPAVPHSAELRRCILAPKGQVLVVVDSSQIEVRVLAWLAGEMWLLEAFTKGYDPYCVFGTKAYGRPITKGDAERQLAKVCVLALGFGMGALRLQQTFAWGTMAPAIVLPFEVCEGFVKMYRSASPAVVALWELLNDAIGDMSLGRQGEHKALWWDRDTLHLPNGMSLHYPHTRATIERRGRAGIFGHGPQREVVLDGSYEGMHGRTKIYGGLFTENVVQALARVLVAEFMRIIAQRYRVVMMSHDEVVYLAPEKQAQKALDFGKEVFRQRPKWAPDLPLDVDGGFDVRYSK